jgi:putative ABC transport system permease protein
MKLSHIALNNLRRRKAKMGFILAGMIIGIATIVTLFAITDAMKTDLGDKFDQIGANIVIVPKTDSLSLSYGGMTVSGVSTEAKQLDGSVPEKILTIGYKDRISTIAPKLITGTTVEGKKALIVGVNFIPELSLKSWWNIRTKDKPEGTNPPLTKEEKKNLKPIRKSMPNLQSNQVIMGQKAAEKLNKKPGDLITIQGKQFSVWGIIDPVGSTVDESINMDLATTQTLFKMPNQLSFIEVAALCTNCPIEDIMAQIQEKLPNDKVTAVREAVKAREETIDKFVNFAKGVSIVVLIIGSLVVFLTMMSSVNERTREIGIFRAIGFRKLHVMIIIFTEAIILSILAGIIGYLVGILIAQVLGPIIAQMEVNIPWNWYLGLQAIMIAIIVGILASILPACQAAKLDPAEALRFI